MLAISSGAQARTAPESFADLADALLPTVVNISTTTKSESAETPPDFEEFFREFFERRGMQPPEPRRRQNSLGSGFIIDKAGYIVTNAHVVENAEEVTVRLYDDATLTATVVGSDKETDLALLKVEADRPLPAAKWGSSERTRIGDWVMAIGNPFGLGGSVTAGIVSARQRDINAGRYDDFLQTDAAINRGNSGGPMFNLDGEVIGVNTAIFSPSGGSVGIGFAIPSLLARNIVEQLREHGEVERGWLGVHIQTVTPELAEGLRMDEPMGALVASVSPEGPAARSGIQQGDVIVSFNGRDVDEMRHLPRMVAETPVGREVPVVILRKGSRETIPVTLGRLDEEKVAAAIPGGGGEQKDGDVPSLGLTLGQVTGELRERYELEDSTGGVLITKVTPGSAAAEKDLQEGDVIVEVDQEKVSTPSDVANHVQRAYKEGYRVVTLLIYREGEFQWVAVRMGEG